MTIAWRVLESNLRAAAPSHWTEAPIGHVAVLINGFPFDSAAFADQGTLPLVRIRDLAGGPLTTWVDGCVPPSAVLRNDDIVVGMDGDFNVAWWSKGPAALNQRLCCLRAKRGTDQRFLFYALPRILKVMNDLTYFTTVKHLASGNLLSERLLLPPLAEQRRIADYLDAETARIDELIAEQTKQQHLHKERFRSLLVASLIQRQPRPDWTRTRLKFLFGFERTGFWGGEPQGDADDVPCVRVADFDRLAFTVGPGVGTIRSVPAAQRLPRLLRRGDVLLEKSGGTGDKPVGCAVTYESDQPAICSNFIAVLRPFDLTHPRWAGLLLAAHYQARLNGPFVKQTTGIQNLDSAAYLGSEVWVPPPAEQRRVAETVDERRDRTIALVGEAADQLQLLQEHRQALITRAVTDGIDGLTGVA